jgi:hypothetical protein
VRHDCIAPLGLTITEAVEALGDRQQSGQRQERHLRANGDPPRQGVRRRCGGLAVAAIAYGLAQARQHEEEINVKPVTRRKLYEPQP